MQVRTINNIKQIRVKTFPKAKTLKTITTSSPVVTPFSAENIRAKFLPVSFKGEENMMDKFCKFLEEMGVSQHLDDEAFKSNKNFDFQGWFNLIDELSDLQIAGDGLCLKEAVVVSPNFSKNFNDPNYNPRKALDFIYAFEQNPDLNLPLSDCIEMMNHFATSNQELDEYVNAIRYFNNIRDKNGESIFFSYLGLIELSDLLKYMLEIDKSSVSASNFQMILDLVADKTIDSNIFKYISPESELTPDVISDVDKLYQAYIEGKNPIDVFIPMYKNIEEATQASQIGDVYALEDNENIFIIDKKGKPTQLNLTREMYFELFPPVERFATTQNLIGNCWEVTGFNSLYADSKTRADILKLFTQNGNDVSITFPNSKLEPITFKDAKMPQTVRKRFFSRGAIGFQLLEFADARELYSEKIDKLYAQLLEEPNLTEDDKDLLERIDINREEIIDKGTLVIEQDADTQKYTYRNYDEEIDHWGNALTSTRHMGEIAGLYRRLGYETPIYDLKVKEVQDVLSKQDFFDVCVISLSTKSSKHSKKANNDLNLDKSKGILASHVYRVLPATKNEKGEITEYYLINPLSATQIKATKQELIEYGEILSCAIKVEDEDEN